MNKALETGLKEMRLQATDGLLEKSMRFVELLSKWNKAYNLTAIKTIDEMVTKHLLDSLSVVPYIKGDRIIDVATGAGLPGLPLALYFPEKQFILLDSQTKRMQFLTQVVGELGLQNVELVDSRVEDYQPEEKFDSVISRAFTALNEFIDKTRHLCKEEGRLFAMKGRYPRDELSALKSDVKIEGTYSLRVPNLEAERHIVVASV